MIPYLRFEILSGTYLSRPYMGLSPPPAPRLHVSRGKQTEDRFGRRYQVIHEFVVVKCCFCYLNILNSNL